MAIMLSVLRFKESDYSFGIFKLFVLQNTTQKTKDGATQTPVDLLLQ
jgi:hypothetical protein